MAELIILKGIRTIVPKERCPRLDLGFGLRLVLGLGAIFLWDNCLRTISKAFRSSRSQLFYKKGVLNDSAKFTEKHFCWNHFLIKLRACFLCSDLCRIFKNTYFLITPQNQKTLLGKQIS